MLCLVPKVVSLNHNPPRENWVVKQGEDKTKMVEVTPRQPPKTNKQNNGYNLLNFLHYFERIHV